MKVVIYDTEHFETTETLIHLFDTPGNHTTGFLAAGVAENIRVGNQRKNLVVKLVEPRNTRNAFTILSYCRKERTDVLILNTVSQHHFYFGLLCLLLRQTRTIVTVHDANSFFCPRPVGSIRSIARFLGARLLAATCSNYAVLLSSTATYINTHFTSGKKIIRLPGSHYRGEPLPVKKSHQHIRVAIPGSIDEKRRDYGQFFQLVDMLKIGSRHFTFILLGSSVSSRGDAIIAKCKQYQSESLQIITYNHFVAREEFDSQLSSADFIFAPLPRFYYEQSARQEEYGVSKSSGSFFDAVRFGKPLLVPDFLVLPPELTTQCIRYSSVRDLSAILSDITPESIRTHTERAIENSRSFTLETLRKLIIPQLQV